jgi:cytochrome P450
VSSAGQVRLGLISPFLQYKYKTYRDAETGEAVPLPLIISDIGVFMMAGMETTAMSFVYMAYGLARDERMWATLRAELDTVDYSDPNFVDQLRGLAYLDALNKVSCPILQRRMRSNAANIFDRRSFESTAPCQFS